MLRPGHPTPPARPGFTLVELLVVVAIIALLISILLPSMSQAKAAGRLSVCGNNQRQIGLAITMYVQDYRGYVPRGPDAAHPFDFGGADIATNQVWIGAEPWIAPTSQRKYTALGVLLETVTPAQNVLYCPGDAAYSSAEELLKIRSDEAAYGSYLYRQLDMLPDAAPRGRMDQMGTNVVDNTPVKVEALVMDTNTKCEGDFRHVNHNGARANVLFRDGSVRAVSNAKDPLSILSDACKAGPPGLVRAIDQILINADWIYHHKTPDEAPRIP